MDDSGGFIDDGGGGFMPNDDAGRFIADDGGGFLPDDDAGGFVLDDDDGGGFVPDENGTSAGPSAGPSTAGDTRATSPTDERLPLRLMPSLLSNLGLPSDEDVLGVFRAIGESDGSGSAPGGVRLKDFRAVCAALMPPDDGDDDDQGEDEDGDGEEEEGGGYEDDNVEMSSGTEDEFEPSDDDEYGAAPIKRTSKRRARREVLEETAAPKLSSRQREAARAIWALLKPDSSGPGSGILSRDEVKRWARELGEMWSDQEVGLGRRERARRRLTADHGHDPAVFGAA